MAQPALYLAIMSLMAPTLSFQSAYRELRPAEKAYVDAYVADVETQAMRNNERITLALYRSIPPAVHAASMGMLDRPIVRIAITERINELSAAADLTPNRVVKEIATIAFSSIGHYGDVREDGQIDWDFTKCTPEQLSAVKSIEIERDTRAPEGSPPRKFKVTLHDKLGALNKLMEYMGLNQADNPVWRADNAKPVHPTALPGTATVESAADAYSALING